ncbi:Mast/stem cell growth factor receptor Kit [Hypsibius exemplaris]|uniref:Mast/stem cell growth factor receptor Kit n=1 Tax=Hypsibius exemplaris TaxID=2072580 RepID=A0A1W0X9H2_HYPEX|nr:Mast/stem cell growth factor receptor Kit [Hypsibius exemplaris]
MNYSHTATENLLSNIVNLLSFFSPAVCQSQGLAIRDESTATAAFWQRLGSTANPRQASSNAEFNWKRGVIPFSFSPDIDGFSRDIHLESFSNFTSLTKNCVRFIEQTDEEDFLHFKSDTPYGSAFGRGRTGGNQSWDLGQYCAGAFCYPQLMRILGFHREYNRADRDHYVSVNWTNINGDPYFATNHQSNLLALPFDPHSVTNRLYYQSWPIILRDISLPPIVSQTGEGFSSAWTKGNGSYCMLRDLSLLDIARILLAYKCYTHEEVYDSLRYAGIILGGDTSVRNNSQIIPGDYQDNVMKNASVSSSTNWRLSISNVRRNATGIGHTMNWPGGVVPYTIGADNLPIPSFMAGRIRQEMGVISNATHGCITFRERTNQRDYIALTYTNDSVILYFPPLGRLGGRWVVRLGGNIENCTHCIMQILLSILGFGIEAERNDRNEYIWLNWGNISPLALRKRLDLLLDRSNDDDLDPADQRRTFGLPYDYQSISHPHWSEWSADSDEPSVVPKKRGQFMGRLGGLSPLDCARLLLGYQCVTPEEVKIELDKMNIRVDDTFPENAVAHSDRQTREAVLQNTLQFIERIREIQERGTANGRFRWTDGRIPFTISEDIDHFDSDIVRKAMNEISDATRACVQFVERKQEPVFVSFTRSNEECYSLYNSTLSEIVFFIKPVCLRNMRQLLGELLVVLGFTAEYKRPDRDKFVYIDFRDVPFLSRNSHYAIDRSANSFGLPYDYASVTNAILSGRSWNNSSLNIVFPNDPKIVANRTESLSLLDRARILLAYRCAEPSDVLAALTGRAVTSSSRSKTELSDKPSSEIVGPLVGSLLGWCFVIITCLVVHILRRKIRFTNSFQYRSHGRPCFVRHIDHLPRPLHRLVIPDRNVTFEKLLDRGQFGSVHKGVAVGLHGVDEPVIVAAKSIDCSTSGQFREFIKEVEIMAILPRHLNVANLLGIVLDGRQLLILEYCSYGSLRRFLRDRCGPARFRNLVTEAGDIEVHIAMIDSTAPTPIEAPRSNSDVLQSFEKPDSTVTAPATPVLTTMDLIQFAYQIARGMEFLVANQVTHCDLAARNVLVCENMVVKICDFGLARRSNCDSIQSKLTALPTKWMAPEAMKQLTFNEKTDVWSFGVTAWEIFSLGDLPYSDLEVFATGPADLNLLLEGGYRMKRPVSAPSFMYALMQQCWAPDPNERPTFRQARINLKRFLKEDYYVILETEYDEYNFTAPDNEFSKSTADTTANVRHLPDVE